MGFVYLITCTITNKVYVGQTINSLRARLTSHKSSARYHRRYLAGEVDAPHNKRGTCSKLYRAMNKHGEDNFYIEILETVPDNDRKMLDQIETDFIEEFNSVKDGYNLKSGGDSSSHSDETKALMKIKNAEHMKTTFRQFRKHDEINDLPMYCIYLRRENSVGVAINKHPLCIRKEFTTKKYNTMEGAKIALLEYLATLEATGVATAKYAKKDADLPKGIRKIKNSYFVDKKRDGRIYRKAFSGFTDEVNKQNAIEYLEQILAQ